MLVSVLSFVGRIGNFASYVIMYFRDKDIRDTQREVDTLINRIAFLEDSLKDAETTCKSITVAMQVEHSIEIETIKAEHVKPHEIDKHSRRIAG